MKFTQPQIVALATVMGGIVSFIVLLLVASPLLFWGPVGIVIYLLIAWAFVHYARKAARG